MHMTNNSVNHVVLFLLAILVSGGCKKTEDAPSYSIDGIRDIDLSDPANGILSLTVRPGTSSESVDLFASDLPTGISAQFNPARGFPPFTSTLTISNSVGTSKGGTYPVHICGTTISANFKSYKSNLIVPEFDKGWSLGTRVIHQGSSLRNNDITINFISDTGQHVLMAYFKSISGLVSGAYNIATSSDALQANDVYIVSYTHGDTWKNIFTNHTANVLVNKGKITLQFPEIEVFCTNTQTRLMLSAKVSEQ